MRRGVSRAEAAAGAVALLVAAVTAARVIPPIIGAATLVAAVAAATVLLVRARRRAADLESVREATASQLDRRISELFSLQELSYILSESIALERIVEQVARYAIRFLEADGALVVLSDDPDGRRLRVASALGSLEGLEGSISDTLDTALVRLAVGRERIEVAQGVATPTVNLFAGTTVRSAAVAPLRAHGVTMGALAVADRHAGPFTTEDLWLLSTVATQASVVLANARLYEMVRRSTEEWETAFNALTEGIAVVGADGQVVRANHALARLAGLPESQLLDRPFTAALFGDAPAAEQLIAATHSGEPPPPLVIRSDPLHRTLRLTAAPLAASDGSATPGGAVVVLVEDVTEQRAMESQLIQNEKMASIGQLVSGVAHELNNPLTSIRGLAELLLERGAGTGDYPREHLRVIYDQAERAGRIVRNLLTFARKGTPEKTAVDLNDVVARTSLLISYELKLRGIELRPELSAEPVTVLGDRYELQQVLLNIVTNAVQAVSDLPEGTPRLITIGTVRHEATVVLRVQDSGPGVPPSLVPYLFTPFFTTKGPGQGTGLGLSLSYGIIDSHGGRLIYAPHAGGAEFVVQLPYVEDTRERVSGETAEMPVPATPPAGRVLVADADASSQRVLGALLGSEGYQVDAARSGEQALRLAAERHYDVVIADAGLATAGGEPLAPALLQQRPEYRGLVLVAGGTRPDDHAPGAADLHWVGKPFNLREVCAAVDEMRARVGG